MDKHLYAIVNYNNLHSWRDIDIPKETNEGFFDLRHIEKYTNSQIVKIQSRGYFYGVLSEKNFINKILSFVFPKNGSYFSVILKRK